jgi:hypothetical protein
MSNVKFKSGEEPPTSDEMLAYINGELSADEEADFRSRVIHYPELVRTLVAQFPEPAAPGDDDYLSDAEFSRHWDEFYMWVDRDTITAAILGELVPELEYAAPLLLERWDRGEPLVGRTSPADLGFETGAIDSVPLELFKSLVPYVKTLLSWGALRVIQAWLSSRRESRHHAELIATLNVFFAEDVRLRHAIEGIADMVGRREGVPVSAEDIVQSVGEATDRVGSTDTGDEGV